MIDLRHGRWEKVLRDDFDDSLVECDHVCTDPPYGARTHEGSRARRYDGADPEDSVPDYDPWDRDDVFSFVRAWDQPCRGWITAMTSDDLIPHYREAFQSVGRLDFLVPIIIPGMTVRTRGDGPSSWALFLMCGRPRGDERRGRDGTPFSEWGTLPGYYLSKPSRFAKKGRGKSESLLRKIISDYSRPGDTVVDPMAGWGSTLIAADGLGRKAIGAEMSAPDYDTARSFFKRGVQADLFGSTAAPIRRQFSVKMIPGTYPVIDGVADIRAKVESNDGLPVESIDVEVDE